MADLQGGGTPQQNPFPGQVSPGRAWPLPPGSPGADVPNTSGQKGDFPPEVARFKWHWGAFGLSWLWAFNHRLPIWGVALLLVWLLSIIPGVGLILLILAVILAINGHKLAWQNRYYPGGFFQYMQVESTWSSWGIVVFVISLLSIPFLAILAAILFPVFAKAREKAREEAAHEHASIQKHMVVHMARASLHDAEFVLPSGVTIRT